MLCGRRFGDVVGGDELPIIIHFFFSVLSGRQAGMNEDRLKRSRGRRGEEGAVFGRELHVASCACVTGQFFARVLGTCSPPK